MKIEILDVLDCKIPIALAKIIKPCLSYTSVYYKQGPYRKIRQEYEKTVMVRGDSCYYFQTGLLDRVIKFCKNKNVPVEIVGEVERLIPKTSPYLEGITFREEQLRLINKGIENQRGVLIAPTGTGKSIIGLAIVSAFPDNQMLWLCHTKDLMYQAADFASKHLKKASIGFIGDGKYEPNTHTFATRQSFIQYVEDKGCDYDIIIVDEVHHLSTHESQYHEIFRNMPAPVRIGLTATMPSDKKAVLAIEGCLGPVIGEVTVEEGQKRDIMAAVKIRFIKVPLNYQIKELRKYSDVYDRGVVYNKEAHKAIINVIKRHVANKESVLVLVVRIEHGENILSECRNNGIEAVFAQGSTEGSVRKQIKDALNSKDIHCVIATTIFSEGVNIPELNVLINAAGGKSEIRTIQAIGRGLRLTETKKELIFYDIFNPSHPYLVSHFGERVCIYSDLGWL
jgi:superfamily II DNA or RNA helicase